MKGSTWLWLIVALIVIGGGIWWWTSMPESATDVNIGTNSPATTTDTVGGTNGGVNAGVDVNVNTAPMTATITYDGSKFTPASVTIKKGGTVTWKNESAGNMWVASAQHPTHTVYDGTSRTEHCAGGGSSTAFDQCAGKKDDYSFKFDKVGSWGFHDHINASAFGKVEVVE